MSKRDYYNVLGVSKDADKSQIKSSYRKLAMKYHPDKNINNKQAEEKFKEASEAAEILLNDDKRRIYDQLGHEGLSGQSDFGGGFSSQNVEDIFGNIFGDILGGNRQRGGQSHGSPGNDLQMSLMIDFEEAIFGVKKTISLSKQMQCKGCHGTGGHKGEQPTACRQCGGRGEIHRSQGFFSMASTCPQCRGSGRQIKRSCSQCHGEGHTIGKTDIEVSIPAGIDVEQRLKLSHKGNAGIQGGPAGDLYIIIDIREHQIFTRDGFNLACTVPISFSQAALGAEIPVPTLTGKVEVKITAGTQSGKKVRLKGKGIVKLGSYGSGDQILNIHVETPSHLTSVQKNIFLQLKQIENDHCHPLGKGFFDKVKDIFQ